jgi:hypothetical protein
MFGYMHLCRLNKNGKHVLLSEEGHWDDVNKVITELETKQAEMFARLVFATEKVEFLCSLIKLKHKNR